MSAALVNTSLDDQKAERVRRSHAKAIQALQESAGGALTIIAGVSLVDGVATPVAHGLGRSPAWVSCGVPVGAVSAGFIVETSPAGADRTQTVYLTASGYGATISVAIGVC